MTLKYNFMVNCGHVEFTGTGSKKENLKLKAEMQQKISVRSKVARPNYCKFYWGQQSVQSVFSNKKKIRGLSFMKVMFIYDFASDHDHKSKPISSTIRIPLKYHIKIHF